MYNDKRAQKPQTNFRKLFFQDGQIKKGRKLEIEELIGVSSMIKRVLGQPNFSPQTNATQLFPKINTNFNNLSSVKVNTNI